MANSDEICLTIGKLVSQRSYEEVDFIMNPLHVGIMSPEIILALLINTLHYKTKFKNRNSFFMAAQQRLIENGEDDMLQGLK